MPSKPGSLSSQIKSSGPTRSSVTLGSTSPQKGARHLGAALGSSSFIQKYLAGKVEEWTSEVKVLARFAITEPHAVYSAFTHGLNSKWTYLCRTMPGTASFLQPVEDAIRKDLVPALLGRAAPGDLERAMLALPTRLGELNLINPTNLTDNHGHQGVPGTCSSSDQTHQGAVLRSQNSSC